METKEYKISPTAKVVVTTDKTNNFGEDIEVIIKNSINDLKRYVTIQCEVLEYQQLDDNIEGRWILFLRNDVRASEERLEECIKREVDNIINYYRDHKKYS